MAVSKHCTGVVMNENGTGHINYEDGSVEWSNLSELSDLATNLDAPDQVDLAHRMLVAYWLARDPEMLSPGIIIGKVLTFDMTSVTPIIVETAP